MIGTIAALVLGLLIASANSSFAIQSGHVQRITANIILLDDLLAQYGPEGHSARELLRAAVGSLVERIWRESRSDSVKVQELSPQGEIQRSLQSRAIQISMDLVQARLLLLQQAGNSIPMPFLAVLVFWLAIIFANFGMFSRLNPTSIGAIFIFALSASSAIFLIVELSQPFSGLMQISSAPLLNALAPL